MRIRRSVEAIGRTAAPEVALDAEGFGEPASIERKGSLFELTLDHWEPQEYVEVCCFPWPSVGRLPQSSTA